jgi:DNA-binding transcriptional MerR regulator
MLPISEFARAGNVTVRALRFYDELGLLSPAYVVPGNGYRRYSPTQFARLNQIQAFKDMGFLLQERTSRTASRPSRTTCSLGGPPRSSQGARSRRRRPARKN